MKNVFRTIARNPFYFSLCLIFAVFAFFYCFLIPKIDGFIFINRLHFRFLDYFFILFTNIGNGIVVICLMMLMLTLKKTGWTVQIGISFVVSGLIAQLLKHLIPSPRPKILLGYENLHYFQGITCNGYGSFPSGHTATIFALMTLFALYFRGRGIGSLFFATALLAGISRIYLSQHFPVDVLAGAVLGIITSICSYTWVPLRFFERKSLAGNGEMQSTNLQ